MVDDPLAFLAALHLSDSALPTGRGVHSNGLEAWLAANPDVGAEEIAELIASSIGESVAPLDGVLVAHAHAAETLDELVALDHLSTACRSSLPAREASLSLGRRLVRVAPLLAAGRVGLLGDYLACVEQGVAPGHNAIVSGATSRALGISQRHAVLIELRGAAVTLVGAAIRLGRLPAMAAQVVLAELAPTLALSADEALSATRDELRSTGGELEVAALSHARARVKLFST